MKKHAFGVSTYLYQSRRLGREHVLEIAAYGFHAVELFATRTHFDFHSPAAISDLERWIAEAGLGLSAVHAPIAESVSQGRWGSPLNLASADKDARQRAVDESIVALQMARLVPFAAFIVHLGLPRPSENSRDAARRSIDALQEAAAPLDVALAIEVIPNELSRAGSLAHFVEEVVEGPGVGICLDVGHAHMDGDLADSIEAVSEHLIAVHLHDNLGRVDDHLVPFDGSIDWPAALTAVQKVGYDGTLMFEVAPRGTAKETLKKARHAREKMDRLLGSEVRA